MAYFVENRKLTVITYAFAYTASRYFETNLNSTNLLSHSHIKEPWCKKLKYFQELSCYSMCNLKYRRCVPEDILQYFIEWGRFC